MRSEDFIINRADIHGSMESHTLTLKRVQDSLRTNVIEKQYQRNTGSSRNSYRPVQWNPLGPFVNKDSVLALMGQACSIWVDSTDFQTIYAGSNTGGLFATYDGGNNWQCLTDNFLTTGVLAIDVDPLNKQHIYIGTGHWGFNRAWGEGVLESFDGGTTWSKTGLNTDVIGGSKLCHDLKLHQQHNDTLYAMLNGEFKSNTFIYRSVNKGIDWEQVFVRPKEELFDFVMTPKRPDIIFAVGSLFLRSNDAGTTWKDYTHLFNLAPNHKISRLTLALTDNAPGLMMVFLESYDTIIPGEYDQRLYRSTNDGRSFREIGYDYQPYSGYWKMELQISPTDPSELYLGGIWFFKYKCGIDTARYQEYFNHKYHKDVRDLLVFQRDGRDILFMANDGGVSRSDDGAIKWKDITRNGFQATQFHGISTTDKSNMVYGGPQDGNVCFYNYDTKEWSTNERMSDAYDGMVDFKDPKYVYIVKYPPKPKRKNMFLLKSSDAGINFDIRGVPDTTERGRNNIPVAMHPTDPKIMYAGLKNVWKSTDRAETWEKISNFSPLNTNLLQSVEVSASDPEVICVSFENPTWGNDEIMKIALTTNGGDKWTDITPRGNYSLSYASVVDILIHPENPVKIYLALDRTWQDRRVYVTQNGGRTWENFSAGLPPIPVNALRYYKGAGYDILFAATDAGVYYRDEFMDRWEMFGEGLPLSIISDIEINYQRKKLIAGTFGRGLWEADICLPLDDNAIVINDTMTWAEGRSVLADLILMPGSQLTMTNKVEVGDGRTIKVMPGAHLVLSGATLTGNCISQWEGIRLYGYHNYDSINRQGKISILYGATIENARTAVDMYSMDYSGKIDSLRGGGVIYAMKAYFRNNLRSVMMRPTVGINPSKFIMTEFNIKEQVWPGEKMNEHVYINSNRGIEFISCTFRNDIPFAELPIMDRGTGIRSFNSSLSIYKISQDSVPIGIAQKPLFYQLRTGIDATTGSLGYSIYMNEVTLKSNYTSAYLSGYSTVYITNCSFELNALKTINLNKSEVTGLYLDHCQLFNITGNTFRSLVLPGFNNTIGGMVVNNCGSLNNMVAGNIFKNLNYSVLAQNNNRNSDGSEGLRFYFNKFTNNEYDICVTTNGGPANNGIAYYQGAMTLPGDSPAGNSFSYNKAHRTSDFHNEGSTVFYTHFNNSPASIGQKPLLYGNLLLSGIVTGIDSSYLPPWILNDTAGLDDAIQQCRELSDRASVNYINTLDGGDSPKLVRDIRHTSVWGVPELYNKLRSLDSKLSQDALAALLRLDHFPNVFLIEVLTRNPVLFRDTTLLPLLSEREPPLPSYMFSRLASCPFNYSDIEFLGASYHNTRAIYESLLTIKANSLLMQSQYKGNSGIDAFIENEQRLPLKYAYACNRMINGDYSSAIQYFKDIRSLYPDSTASINLFDKLLRLNEELRTEAADTLTTAQLSIIDLLHDSPQTFIYAENLLKQYGDGSYTEPYIFPTVTPSPPIYQIPEVNIIGSNFNIYPQPANDFLIVDYSYESGFTNGYIEISDLSGRPVRTISVEGNYGQKVIDVNDYLAGIYILRIIADDNIVEYRKLLIIH